MNKLTPELEKIRDEAADPEYLSYTNSRDIFIDGFDICFKAMSKTHVPLTEITKLKARIEKLEGEVYQKDREIEALIFWGSNE